MKSLFKKRSFYIIATVLIILFVIYMAIRASSNDGGVKITTIVETGLVQQLVSVSGIAEAEQLAELSFPTSGIVERVAVRVGDVVNVGDILIELDTRTLRADRQEAVAAVSKAVADRDELFSGPTGSARDVTSETVLVKQLALNTTKETEAQKISNAYHTLLSYDLTAYSEDGEEDATPPTLSGTYNCDLEGLYNLDIFSSGSQSGYSYKLTGIEKGTFSVSVEQPTPLGDCGLRILFDENSFYNSTEWTIEIPNTKSSFFVANKNAYDLSVSQGETAITVAEQALALAKASAINQNAPARSEAVDRANATIAQAQARLNRIDSTIADRTLRAPFAGTVTEIDILPGETVTNAPILTLLANNKFEVTARIPEIDIGKLLIGQKTKMVFDARSNEILTGEVSFISLKSTEIDGVAYYKAIIQLDETPAWIRSGLNADIEIIINKEENSLRVPKRFVSKTDSGYEVLSLKDETTSSTTVELIMEGNDGFVAITGINEGDILVAP